MDVFPAVVVLTIIAGAFSVIAMIAKEHRRRQYHPAELAVIKVFIALWVVLVLLAVGVPWFIAVPVVFGLVFVISRRYYRKVRRELQQLK